MKKREVLFSGLTRSALMSRIRGTGNKTTEQRLAAVFRSQGITGWRRNSTLVGRPDFVFPKTLTALFVDGCFWHGCPKHGLHARKRLTASAKTSFWQAKITGNKARDRKVNRLLKSKGWSVLRIWEHELSRKNAPKLLKRLRPLVH